MKSPTVERFANIEELDAESKYLVHKAKDATQHSYAPYSKFNVGAALILEDGTIVTGSNQENASYPLCMCAERVALYTAATMHPHKRITKMAVVAHKKNHKELTPATSCGACAQVMLEFEARQDKPFQVIMLAQDNQWLKCSSVSALLPMGFTKDSL
ncbi:MAG TPA: cytidine deaminase [Cyclobacteriaceae bacterium]